MKAFGGLWAEVATVAFTTLAIYITVVVGLRVAGRRTVSQMSAFDFVVTIAIGSLVAATPLAADASYLRGAASLVRLLAAQQVVAVIRQRVPAAQRFLDFSSTTSLSRRWAAATSPPLDGAGHGSGTP